MKVIEDAGFFCMDNIPIDIFMRLIDLNVFDYVDTPRLCIGIDVRGGLETFAEKAPGTFSYLKDVLGGFKLVFMYSDKNVLLNRFKETRRRHPLSESHPNLLDAITAEMELMKPVKNLADFSIDSSELNVHELKTRIDELLLQHDKTRDMHIEICSFGFKKGIPIDADIVMDVRFLPNPYFVRNLKDKTGKDLEVVDFLKKQESFLDFMRKFEDMISFVLPLYKKEGRAYLKIAIGCTGGMHRSVAVAEAVSELVKNSGFDAKLIHRDLS